MRIDSVTLSGFRCFGPAPITMPISSEITAVVRPNAAGKTALLQAVSIDGSIATAAPSGSGGSIIGTCPAIGLKRVVDATVITKKVLEIELPPEIIQPGGYASCEEMIADLVPKLERVFVGDLKVKKPKPVQAAEPV